MLKLLFGVIPKLNNESKIIIRSITPNKKVESTIQKKETIKIQINEELLKNLKYIFEKLDEDADGEISSSKIQLLNINVNVLEIIQDILVDMDEKNEILNFDRFHKKIIEFKMESELENVDKSFMLLIIVFLVF